MSRWSGTPLGSRCRNCSLATLLHESAHELLRVLLEHLVDVVQNAVDILIQLVLAFLQILGSLVLGGGILLLPRLLRLALPTATCVTCHLTPPRHGAACSLRRTAG